ncbi:hypothetical protein K4L06_13510 [Lysobacter sp. BMK333-48F3]|uniref:hypothetical protein n=1 Tax=Lysobacter sp. BMK333-48F3 TaxID=2867962 RepID=UPI001C8C521B|nr:hypothetical protein [Lysobacter sp. BMK333-48F3]MBX9402326.1 hypothetical protein [Lysobacter sp. BMK333-48F3]
MSKSPASGSSVRIGDRRTRLGALIKSGGAGSVYLLPEFPERVAKIYHERVDPPSYTDRVEAMLELRPQLPDQFEGGKRYVQIAWPDAAVRDERGGFVGFSMPALDVQSTSELEQVLQERQARAAGLPVGLGPKITLAANLAAVLAALHAQHHYVVDLKPVNLRFYRASLYIALLDCDGFSIQGRGRRYSAPQFTPDYLAPEFQQRGPDPLGEEAQDRFALAVVIFQLLNFGLHPYTGKPGADRVPTDIPSRIRERYYAYGLRAHRLMAPSPVSAHASVPRELRELFDRAFGDGGERPSAADWSAALRDYARPSSGRLVVCKREREHQHYAGQACASCARQDLLAKTARKARPRPVVEPPRMPAAQPAAARLRAPRLGRPPPRLTPAAAPARLPRPAWWSNLRLATKSRGMLAVAFPVLFAFIAQGLHRVYAALQPDPANRPLEAWLDAMLMTGLGAAFLVLCWVFAVTLPRLLKTR